MAAGKLIAGVEVSAAGIRVALLTLKPVPTVVHCEEVLMQPGDEPRIGQILASVLTQYGANKADVHLVFSPPQPAPGRHHLFTTPKLSRAELIQVAAREMKRDGTLDPNNAYYSIDALDAIEGETGGGQRYLLVALAKEPVDVAALALLEAKLVVRSATTSAMGLLRAATLADMPANGIVALAQLDIRRSTLIVLENGVPRFFRDIPTSFAKGGREGADDALIAQALARELDISLVFFAQQNRPKQVDTVMIVGDAEVAERVCEWLEDSQSYRVVRFGANDKLRALPNTPTNLLPYAAAIGAAMGARRGPVSDVLPSELRGRPERIIATIVGAVALLVFMLGVLQLRSGTVRATEEAEARLRNVRSQFTDLQRRVDSAASLDAELAQADKWKTFFEHLELYHKRYGNLLYSLQRTVPLRGRMSAIALSDAPGPRKPPPSGKKDANLLLDLAGIVRDADLQSAQVDVLTIFHAAESVTPDVQQATLTPLQQAPSKEGIVELPFRINLNVADPYPIVSKR